MTIVMQRMFSYDTDSFKSGYCIFKEYMIKYYRAKKDRRPAPAVNLGELIT